ncbi:hypothetical protein BC829DRAFT_413024 [Chytridium lagenaria]|nr:hypothetical protein BC829DRAFT_413024 [Chytridium lagenaria]
MFHSKDSLSSATSSRSLAEVGGSDIDDVIEPLIQNLLEKGGRAFKSYESFKRISRMKKSSVNPEREATSADTKNLKSLISKPIVEENSIPKETAAFEDKSLQPEENLRNTKNLTATSSEFTDYTIVGKTSLKSKEELPESQFTERVIPGLLTHSLRLISSILKAKIWQYHNLVINLNAAQSKLADENSRLLREELLKTAEKIEKIAGPKCDGEKVESISKPASVAAAKEMSNLQEITSGPNKALKEEQHPF